ncbi:MULTISPECIES: hypothetical protein [Bacteria]|uniref:Uncharacterized protein n=1 Tax=Escherichia coli TaxID=562 RepID=A0ABD5C456_ECOLX|nr:MULTISPECIES: hypothetical protein [Enterobacteriaceae]HDL8517138.1 hypothetical protein [Yersinia enterocolitica]ELR5578970.1 hypothetical protein [Escherichia coli]MDR5970806.1 hypothetical protein [Escherichia coli]MDR6023793.1 hypothetical protein [Escherichia coli]MDR6048083.1 hypothetical protein [Escherichia coli]
MVDHILANISVYMTKTVPQMNIPEIIVSVLAVLVIIHALVLLGRVLFQRYRKNTKGS